MKISIIGTGMVGTEITSYLLTLGSVSEIVMVDKNKDKTLGELIDFSHTESFTYAKNTRLVSGDYADCWGSDVVVITAGAQIKVGQPRDELAQINSEIVVNIVGQVERYAPDAIVIIVTNPVDVVTYHAFKNSKYRKEKILSSGTLLDTARLMKIISDEVNIDPKNIFGFVLGEHGSSAVIPWSVCNICGLDVDTFCTMNDYPKLDKKKIHEKVLKIGYEIFSKKGNTNHGIAASVFRIIRAISIDENSVLPIGVYIDNLYGMSDVVLSLPAIVNKKGAQKILNYKLTDSEMKALKGSYEYVKEMIVNVKI